MAFLYMIAGAIVIGALGTWSKQHRATILILCGLWGGFVNIALR